MEQLPVIWSAARCGYADWQGIWGDPWLSGTVIVLAYALTGILVIRTSRKLVGRERGLWTMCGAVLVLQAFNTPLDLHAFVWTFGKCLSKAQGWYANRGGVQLLVLLLLLCTALVIVALCAFMFRRNIKHNLLLILGIVIAVGFTGVKGISVHGLASLYGRQLGPFHVVDWIELTGIALAFIALLQRRRRLSHD